MGVHAPSTRYLFRVHAHAHARLQVRLKEMMADGSFNINTANCNTGMSKALFFVNGTNTTDVSGTTLDMAEYVHIRRGARIAHGCGAGVLSLPLGLSQTLIN